MSSIEMALRNAGVLDDFLQRCRELGISATEFFTRSTDDSGVHHISDEKWQAVIAQVVEEDLKLAQSNPSASLDAMYTLMQCNPIHFTMEEVYDFTHE